jgi:hypothetical protein
VAGASTLIGDSVLSISTLIGHSVLSVSTLIGDGVFLTVSWKGPEMEDGVFQPEYFRLSTKDNTV